MRHLLLLVFVTLLASAAAEEPRVRTLAPGVLQVGPVRVEQATRSVRVPAKVNQSEGPLEYLLVAEHGPTHESLLLTAAPPQDIHTAMLLLGAKGTPEAKITAPTQLNAEFLAQAPLPEGEPVRLILHWKGADGKPRQAAAEDWLRYGEPPAAVPAGPWTYNGSQFTGGGKFAAQVEGYVAALVTSPYALINNPRPSRTDDLHWRAHPGVLPPRDTPVELEIILAP